MGVRGGGRPLNIWDRDIQIYQGNKHWYHETRRNHWFHTFHIKRQLKECLLCGFPPLQRIHKSWSRWAELLTSYQDIMNNMHVCLRVIHLASWRSRTRKIGFFPVCWKLHARLLHMSPRLLISNSIGKQPSARSNMCTRNICCGSHISFSGWIKHVAAVNAPLTPHIYCTSTFTWGWNYLHTFRNETKDKQQKMCFCSSIRNISKKSFVQKRLTCTRLLKNTKEKSLLKPQLCESTRHRELKWMREIISVLRGRHSASIKRTPSHLSGLGTRTRERSACSRTPEVWHYFNFM